MSTRTSKKTRVACAPISWGVIEVPDWGYQMPAEEVLAQASRLGVTAMEAGPEGFLPDDPEKVREMLAGYGLSLVGGFVPVVLHDPAVRDSELSAFERRADFFAAAGAEVVVLAAATGSEDYGEIAELSDAQWDQLFENLARAEEISAQRELVLSVHSHYGTVIETDEQLWRFLKGCDTGLCLDTGHLAIGGSDPVEVAKKAGERINHVHLKDVDREVARRLGAREIGFKEACLEETFRPLGEGDVEVGQVVELLEKSGYRGWYVLEQDRVLDAAPDEDGGPLADIRKSLAYLHERSGLEV